MVTISPVRATPAVYAAPPRVSGVAWDRSRKEQWTHIRPRAGDRTTCTTHRSVPSICTTPVTSPAFRSTTSPAGPEFTVYDESGHNGEGSGIEGSILALCRRPIRNRGSVR